MVGSWFSDLIAKEGEIVSYYAHSFSSSRNSTTNLKTSEWAAAANKTVVVRSQPVMFSQDKAGSNTSEEIVILCASELTPLSVVKWGSKYFDIVTSEPVYWKGVQQYFRCLCRRRLEFIGA